MYAYQFGWRARNPALGACHGIDIPFTFGNFVDGWDDFVGADGGAHALSHTMRQAWADLAYDGDPGWPEVPASMCFERHRGVVEDPLHFSDGKPYKDRLAAARKATGEPDAMAIGYGKVGGVDAVVLVQDFAFMGGSLGMAVGEIFIKAAHEAIARDCPFVVFTAAGGARMQEGALSLMQMARTTLALNEVKAAGLPYIVVLTDPTTGGVTASYAMLGDIHLAEPNAMMKISAVFTMRMIRDLSNVSASWPDRADNRKKGRIASPVASAVKCSSMFGSLKTLYSP